MRLGTAIEKLVDNYKYAVDKEWIQDKVAWALYHTWKEADEQRAEQTEPKDLRNVSQGFRKVTQAEQTEPSFKVDGVGDNDPTIHAIAHLQKVGWLQKHDRALTENLKSETQNSNSEFEKVDCGWK